jgi:hypothetical protein
MWVLTSKRHRGGPRTPPRVEFKIGEISIANIVMTSGQKGGPWTFIIETNHNSDDYDHTVYNSFGEALSELHRRLSSPSPEGYETK